MGMEWINVNGRLPESPIKVLCLSPKGQMFVGQYTKGHELQFDDEDYSGEFDPIEEKDGTLYLKAGWYELEEQAEGAYDSYWMNRNVSNWMPLPSPPSAQ